MPGKKKTQSDLQHRSFSIRLDSGNRPASLDEAKRSVEVVAATEAPCPVFDSKTWTTWPEVLPVSRAVLPEKSSPLLDAHNRFSTGDIIGSAKDWRVSGDQILAVAEFSKVEKAENAFQLLSEGHLTDVSVGYRVNKYLRIEDGEQGELDGKSYDGPALVALEWEIKELSFCPIGADHDAKARALEGHKQQEESNMNEWLKRMAAKLGLSEDATEEQVREAVEQEIAVRKTAGEDFADLVEPDDSARSAGNVVHLDAVRGVVRDELNRERASEADRAREINALCKAHGMEDQAGDMIADGLTVEEAQRKVLDGISQRGPGEFPGYGRIEMGMPEVDKVREVMTDSILIRAGVSLDNPAEGFGDFAGMQLRELCRDLLIRNGLDHRGDPMKMVVRAMSSSDLPNILSNVANKALFSGYEGAEETYEQWVDTSGTFADFNPKTIAKLGKLGSLREVKEGGEYKNVTISDEGETIKAIKFGEIFPITMETIINDDLDALTALPSEMGESAATTLGDIAYGVLTANAKMGDGTALFHANHKNLGTAGAPGTDTIGEMVLKMGTQKAPGDKRTLNIRPEFLIFPLALHGSAEEFFATKDIVDADTNETRANIYQGRYTRVYDARLDDDSAASWYASGRKGKGVKMFFLNGVKRPQVMQRDGWRTDGIELKIMLAAAAKAMDWRYLFKNAG